jgi:hypothetical protein
MNFRRTINLFPWDVAAEGASACLEMIAGLGCNSVILSPAYHRARLFRPRAPGFYHRPVDWCDFAPTDSLYDEPALLPPVNPDQACRHASALAVAAARAAGLEVIVSIIGCHNTTIGLAHPELCVENAFGDRYAFALCPAQSRVRRLLINVVTDLARQLQPDSLLLDSFCFLDAVHREHHELMFVSPGAVGKYLLGLCFCPACCALLRAEGIQPERWRSEVRERVGACVRRGPATRTSEGERDELHGLFFECAEVLAAQRARQRAVEDLLRLTRKAASDEEVDLHNQSGLLARPSARAWTEGAGLRDRARYCDQVFLQAYFNSAQAAVQDLTWAATMLPAERLVLASMVGEDHIASASDLVQRVTAARTIGAAGVSYYNYGLLSADRLRWIAEANRQTL